jgi:hypothetical protein
MRSVEASIRSRAAKTCVRGVGAGSEEVAALHGRPGREAGEAEQGGGHVDAGDQLPVDRAGTAAVGPGDEKRHVEAAVVEKLLGAEQALAVVAHKDDDGVAGEAVGLQAAQHFADEVVHQRDGVEVVGVLLAGDRVVRVIGRERHLAGVDMPDGRVR